MKRAWDVLTATWDRYREEHGHLLAAAFSLYSLLAIAPLCVIAVSVAGLVVDPDDARRALLSSVERSSSQGFSGLFLELLDSTRRQGTGWATVVATALLIWAASRLFLVLQEALNAIWGVQVVVAESMLATIKRLAVKRLISFAMVIGCGALLLIVLALQTVLSSVRGSVLQFLHLEERTGRWLFLQQSLLSFLLLSVVVALIYKLLPDASIRWRDVRGGAALTAAMMLLGSWLLGLYLSRIAPAWVAGAVGSIAAFLFWCYYQAQVFLLGAALTRVLSARGGRDPGPAPPHAKLRPTGKPRGRHGAAAIGPSATAPP
jgi:membrane protein